MPAGYSGTPLAKKLGIKPGVRVVALGVPVDYRELLEPIPEGATIDVLLPAAGGTCELAAAASFVHIFTTERAVLEAELPRLKGALEKDGILWVSWPKKAAKVPTDLDGNVVRRLGLDAGLVDVKVCAVDATWSGLKFVNRLKDR